MTTTPLTLLPWVLEILPVGVLAIRTTLAAVEGLLRLLDPLLRLAPAGFMTDRAHLLRLLAQP